MDHPADAVNAGLIMHYGVVIGHCTKKECECTPNNVPDDVRRCGHFRALDQTKTNNERCIECGAKPENCAVCRESGLCLTTPFCPKSQAVAQKGYFDRLTAIRKRRRIGRIYIFSAFFQEKTFAIRFLASILRLTRRCRTYARAYEKATRNQTATELAKAACRVGHHFGRLRHLWAICDRVISIAPRVAALIFIFVIGIGVVGFYEPAHAVDRAGRGFINATESASSDLAGFFRPSIKIFDEPKTAEKLRTIPDGLNSLIIQASERKNIACTYSDAKPAFWIADIWSSRRSHVGRQLSVWIDNVEVHTDAGNNRLSVPYVSINYIYSDWLIRAESDKPYVLDSNFWPMTRGKFGAGEFELKKIHSAQSDSRNSQNCRKASKDASENSEPSIITGNSFFWIFFGGAIAGAIGVFGGGALAWRLWGV